MRGMVLAAPHCRSDAEAQEGLPEAAPRCASDEQIPGLNIPTGMPLVYELDKDLKSLDRYYIGDPEKVKAAFEKGVLKVTLPKPEEVKQKRRRIEVKPAA